MRRALYLPPFGTFGDVHLLVELARAAEESGWDGFFMWDHVLYAADVPFVDTWIALSAIASSTERITLGPLITPLPRRRPWKVAREAITLDHLSNGRLVLGVGLGIDFWREFSAFGEPATTDAVRAEMTDEGIFVLTLLMSGGTVKFRGDHFTVEDVQFLPRPVQQPRVPIWSAALWPIHPGPTRRAAVCDGVMPFGVAGPLTPDDVRSLRAAIDAERTSDAPYDVCLHGQRALAADYEAAGVTWLCDSLDPDADIAQVRRLIAAGP